MSDTLFGALSGLPSFEDDMARYRGFRKVLFEDDEGRKVLNDILGWCRMLNVMPPVVPIDSNLLAYREGERHVGFQILEAMLKEPRDKPTQAVRYNPKAARR